MSWQQPGGGAPGQNPNFNYNAPAWTPGGGYAPQPPAQQQPGGYPGYQGYPAQAGFPAQQQYGYGQGYPQQQGYAPPQQQYPGNYNPYPGYNPAAVYNPANQAQRNAAPTVPTPAPVPAPAPAPAPSAAETSKLQLSGGSKKNDIVMPKRTGGGKVLTLGPKPTDPPKPTEPTATAAKPAEGAPAKSPTDAPSTSASGAAAAPAPTEGASGAAAAPAPKAAKKPVKEYVRDPRPHFNIVFCGHVDAGKSTVSGHLLADHNVIDEREMAKLKLIAQQNHREGWEYAYVMDASEEERERGKTHETGSAYFETTERRITVLDAPGHKAFVPSMIGGATQADLAVMVISARVGEFETGFEKAGQTREHTMLLRTCGIKHLICVVNKMDDVAWSQERYQEIVSKTQPFFKQNGFMEENKSLIYMPIAGLKGQGLSQTVPPECTWYTGPTLLAHINQLKLPQGRTENDPLCIPITGSYMEDGKLFIYGKIESGGIVPGDDVMLLPTKKKVIIEAVQVEQAQIEKGYPGDMVHLRVRNIEEADVHAGFCLVAIDTPMKAVEFFQARVVILDVKNIISSGSRMMLHMHAATEEVTIDALLGKLDKKGEPIEANPACAKAGDIILARLELEHPLVTAVQKDFDKIGRFMLREDGRTIAIGLVTKLYESTKESLKQAGKR